MTKGSKPKYCINECSDRLGKVELIDIGGDCYRCPVCGTKQ